MKEIAVRFPPRMLLVGGVPLKNYHYFVDILMGEFHRLGGFDPLDLYFRFFTFLFVGPNLCPVLTRAAADKDQRIILSCDSGKFGQSFRCQLGDVPKDKK